MRAYPGCMSMGEGPRLQVILVPTQLEMFNQPPPSRCPFLTRGVPVAGRAPLPPPVPRRFSATPHSSGSPTVRAFKMFLLFRLLSARRSDPCVRHRGPELVVGGDAIGVGPDPRYRQIREFVSKHDPNGAPLALWPLWPHARILVQLPLRVSPRPDDRGRWTRTAGDLCWRADALGVLGEDDPRPPMRARQPP